jgi:mRNA interferase MazF
MTHHFHRGDIFWMPVVDEYGELRPIIHPNVVVQDDAINASRLTSLVVCGLSTNMRLAHQPGNVLLLPGEANLPKQSIVVVSQVSLVHKHQVGEYIGTLDARRMEQVLAGMRVIARLRGER